MITCKTVFVLGAGAHCPYGLPDGRTLTNRIVEALPSRREQNNSFSECFIDRCGSKFGSIADTLVEFRTRLEHSGHANRSAYPEIGKMGVADVLLPMEFKKDFSRLS
jgi:hypothetical protein